MAGTERRSIACRRGVDRILTFDRAFDELDGIERYAR